MEYRIDTKADKYFCEKRNFKRFGESFAVAFVEANSTCL